MEVNGKDYPIYYGTYKMYLKCLKPPTSWCFIHPIPQGTPKGYHQSSARRCLASTAFPRRPRWWHRLPRHRPSLPAELRSGKGSAGWRRCVSGWSTAGVQWIPVGRAPSVAMLEKTEENYLKGLGSTETYTWTWGKTWEKHIWLGLYRVYVSHVYFIVIEPWWCKHLPHLKPKAPVLGSGSSRVGWTPPHRILRILPSNCLQRAPKNTSCAPGRWTVSNSSRTTISTQVRIQFLLELYNIQVHWHYWIISFISTSWFHFCCWTIVCVSMYPDMHQYPSPLCLNRVWSTAFLPVQFITTLVHPHFLLPSNASKFRRILIKVDLHPSLHFSQTHHSIQKFPMNLRMNHLVGGLNPSEKYMTSSVGMMTFPIIMENHQIPWFQTTKQSFIFHYRRVNLQ